jgi:UDP-N-acetylmuramate dehydrogenase
MDIKKIYDLDIGEVFFDVDLSKYTTYKLKGIGKILVVPRDILSLKKLLDYIKKNNIKYKILGNGSNLIFKNEVYDGILIKLDNLNDFKIDGNVVTVGAGYNLMKLALKCSMLGLSGLEFATGIPGSVGGSVYMNAGAYNSDISSILDSAMVLTSDLDIVKYSNDDFDFSYRHSCLQDKDGYICLSAVFKLSYGDRDSIMELVNNRRERRILSQPLEFPSAGSVFRNPLNDYAGRLIEEIGYKGKKIGDACVSSKHANFIVNIGNATGHDICALIDNIKDEVKNRYGIELKVEQEIVE